jgi:hypothetical protein
MNKLIILILLIISFSNCRAQNLDATQGANYHRHKGFFLSLSGGPNFSGISADVSGQNKINYAGSGPILDLKIGGAIKENLILHATLGTDFMSGPKISSNGESQNTSDNFLIGEDFIGGGMTYYLMPSNILLSGSLGLGNFRRMDTDDNTSVSSDKGFGFQLKVGKEWWVSKRWGLGVALSYSKINVKNTPGGGLVELMNSNNFGIHFNATLN